MKLINKYVFLGLGLIGLYIDTLSPLGFSDWLIYVLLIYIFAQYANRKNDIILITATYSVFIILGYFLSPALTHNKSIPIFNRGTAILVLSVITYLAYQESKIKKVNSEILERMNDFFLDLDKDFKIKYLNTAALSMLKNREEIISKYFFEIFPEASNYLREKFEEALKNLKPLHIEDELFTRGIFIDLFIYPSENGITLVARDISEAVKSERKSKKLLLEKEILLKEIHHRTKNNLQLILSLMNLQIDKIDNEVAANILNETRSRIMSISSLHEKLYFKGNIHVVDMDTFVEDIVERMESAANFGLLKINHHFEIENIKLKMENAIPIGLIVNELYTNSLKYAFKDNNRNDVIIKMRFLTDDTLFLYYKDNGSGLPEGYDLNKSNGLGSSIIAAFIQQLKGNVEYRNNNGAEFEFTLKVTKEDNVPALPTMNNEIIFN